MGRQRGHLNPAAPSELILPAKHSAGFARVFAWYTRRLLAKKFHAVRLAKGGQALAAQLDTDPRPVILLLNHSSWWDPLIGFAVGSNLLQSRIGIAPMDRSQLERFSFFRKLGLFGIDPDNPASMSAMLDYATSFVRNSTRPTIALTPQGRFTDVREPIVLRPGAAALCSTLGDVRAAILSIEYAFWQDQRPEVFLRLADVHAPQSPSTTGWQRALTAAMTDSCQALAAMVIARDPTAFDPLLARAGSSVNPVYDLFLKLRGKSGEIAARRNASPADHPTRHPPTPIESARP